MGKIKIAAASCFLMFCLAQSLPGQNGELLTDSVMEVESVKKGGKIIIPGFYFDDSSPEINVNLKKFLEKIAAEIKKTRYAKIYVDGYTDNMGDNSANNRLSRARARGVKKELVKNGIPADKIQARAYGAIKPIAGNDTRTGRIQNRRIEILIK